MAHSLPGSIRIMDDGFVPVGTALIRSTFLSCGQLHTFVALTREMVIKI